MQKAAILTCMTAAVVLGLYASTARALPKFKKAFDDRYVQTSDNEAFKAAFDKAGCSVCHVAGKSDRKLRNPYGQALSKIIGGDAKKRLSAAKAKGGQTAEDAEMATLLKQIDAAFTKVESEKSPSGPTFGELIKAGKLPAGK